MKRCWTDSETSFLNENYTTMSMYNLLEVLDKTEKQIYSKILNIKKKNINIKPKHFIEFMPMTVEVEEPFEDVRKRDYSRFFENYKGRNE